MADLERALHFLQLFLKAQRDLFSVSLKVLSKKVSILGIKIYNKLFFKWPNLVIKIKLKSFFFTF